MRKMYTDAFDDASFDINNEPQKDKRGHWIYIRKDRQNNLIANCSCCMAVSKSGKPYCWNCNAQMDEVHN